MYCNNNAVLQIITKLITIDRGYFVLPPNRRYSYLTEPLLQDTHGTQVIVLVFNMFISYLCYLHWEVFPAYRIVVDEQDDPRSLFQIAQHLSAIR